MVSQPYADGITDKLSHRTASGLTAGQAAADRGHAWPPGGLS